MRPYHYRRLTSTGHGDSDSMNMPFSGVGWPNAGMTKKHLLIFSCCMRYEMAILCFWEVFRSLNPRLVFHSAAFPLLMVHLGTIAHAYLASFNTRFSSQKSRIFLLLFRNNAREKRKQKRIWGRDPRWCSRCRFVSKPVLAVYWYSLYESHRGDLIAISEFWCYGGTVIHAFRYIRSNVVTNRMFVVYTLVLCLLPQLCRWLLLPCLQVITTKKNVTQICRHASESHNLPWNSFRSIAIISISCTYILVA